MKNLTNYGVIAVKSLAFVAITLLFLDCAPKRRETEFAKNKAAEAGHVYTDDQLRAALGADRYDALVSGIGQANLNLLSYGIGISNMAQLMNAITGPGKLVTLMSDRPNSRKLNAIQVLDLLNKVDDACQAPGSLGTDTLMKVANLINAVSLAGMDGLKNIVHGILDQPADPNGAPYSTNAMARLGLLVSLVNEVVSAMPTLVNDITAPGGIYSAAGTAQLIRLINNTYDMRDIAVIVNETSSLANITGVLTGLTKTIYCSKAEYATKTMCENNGGAWANASCPAFPANTTRATCEAAGGAWTPDGTENMLRVLNESNRACFNGSAIDNAITNGTACWNAGGRIWKPQAAKLATIINNISNVSNLYNIVNGLTNDARRPDYCTHPAYGNQADCTAAGHTWQASANTFDGVDSLIATLNNLKVNQASPQPQETNAYGPESIKRMAYFINNLDTVLVASNDETFDTGSDCANGLFDNLLNWAFSNNNATTAAPWFGKSFRSTNAAAQAGTCSIANDNTVASEATQTQSVELVANLTASGNVVFYHRVAAALIAGENVKFFVDDVLNTTLATNTAWASYTYAATAGIHRFRWEIYRAVGSTSQLFLDSVTLPGDKGAPRTAAEKTAIMLNNIYIASSITNVAEIMSNVTAPACIATPLTCTPTNDNGLDALIVTIKRAEYPAVITDAPRLATTVNTISNVPIMYNILNNLTTTDATRQLLAMLDFVQTPATIPNLINALTGDAGAKVGVILNNNNAAGTINLLRVIADTASGGVPVADVADFINRLNITSHVSVILNKTALTANVRIAATVQINAAPTGGAKLAQFFNQINAVADPCVANPTTDAEKSQFCIRNHLVRLVNDVAASASGPTIIAEIVSGMRPDTAGAGGSTGVVRMTDIMKDLKTMSSAPAYANGLANTTPDQYGRLTAMISDMGGTGGINTARIINEVDKAYHLPRVSWLIKNINRVRYISRLLSEMNSVDLMLQLLNDANTNIANINTLVNGQGNLAYGTNATATNLAAFYTVPSQTGHMPVRTQDYGLSPGPGRAAGDGSGLDTLGRLIQLINGVSGGITNVITLINVIADLKYIAAVNGVTTPNSMPLPYNPDAGGARNYGYGMINEANQTNFISNLMNGVSNLDLLLTIIDGPGSCSNTTYQSRTTCLANAATWTEGSMGACSGVALTSISNANPAVVTKTAHSLANGDAVTFTTTGTLPAPLTTADVYFVVGAAANTFNLSRTFGGPALATTSAGSGTHTVWGYDTQAQCTAGGGTWTQKSPTVQNSAQYSKLISLINDVGGSTRKGSGTKTVGEMSILSGLINDLGYVNGNPAPIANQARIITVLNDVVYCGINPVNDRNISNDVAAGNPGGPNCSIAAYTNEVSCLGAGATWRNTAQVLACNQPIGYAYSKVNDHYDPRPRVANAILSVNDSYPLSVVIGQVDSTKKTVRILNGVRRSNTILKVVNVLPAEATRDLVNTVILRQMYPAFDFLSNTLSHDEDIAAEAFASMIFWGNSIGQGASRTGTRMDFKAIGPKRLGGILNTESGSYLGTLMSIFGWRTVIPLMMYGLSPSGTTLNSYSGYNEPPDWVTTGTAVNANATGSTCTATNAEKCMYIPGRLGTPLFKQKEVMTTAGSCSDATRKTRFTCAAAGGTWNQAAGSTTWIFGVQTATDVANARQYYPETVCGTALIITSCFPVHDVPWLGVNVASLVRSAAGIGATWRVLKSGQIQGALTADISSMNLPPLVGTGYTCTGSGGAGVTGTSEYACVDDGMADNNGADNIAGTDDDNASLYRYGNHCSITRVTGSATNCDANYTTCEGTCKGTWIPDRDWPTHRVNPFSGVEPIQ